MALIRMKPDELFSADEKNTPLEIKKNDFFYAGTPNAFKFDFVDRTFLCQGKSAKHNFPNKTEQKVNEKLKVLYGQDAENIQTGYSQFAAGTAVNLISSVCLDHLFSAQSKNVTANITKENGKIYLDTTYSSIDFVNLDTGESYTIKCSIKTRHILKQKDNIWGFELVSLETNNKFLSDLYRGEKFDSKKLKDKAILNILADIEDGGIKKSAYETFAPIIKLENNLNELSNSAVAIFSAIAVATNNSKEKITDYYKKIARTLYQLSPQQFMKTIKILEFNLGISSNDFLKTKLLKKVGFSEEEIKNIKDTQSAHQLIKIKQTIQTSEHRTRTNISSRRFKI